jgi:hypothetical protein
VEDAVPQGVPAGGLQTGHEQTTIQVRGVLIGTAGLVLTIFVCQLVLGLWMRGFERKEERVNALYPGRNAIEVDQFPQPRLQESPPVDLVTMLREERARTSSYGWIDKKAGIARIPVDRAMDILAQKGLPKVAAPPPTPGAPPDTTIPPARKREEAGPEESQPARPERKEQPRPDSKQGGKP